jgi:hypothetical protein
MPLPRRLNARLNRNAVDRCLNVETQYIMLF